MIRDWLDDARSRLLGLRQGPGAWGYRARSRPAAEPSSLAALAILAGSSEEGRAVAMAAGRRLATIQQADGSIGVSGDLTVPGWPTSLALLVWSNLDGFEAERARAVGWLLGDKGTSLSRTKDDPMGHDTSIVGWPWVAGTHSWVEPTAMALLALSRQGISDHPRVREGVRLLLDRAIPTGGWNLGNPIVFQKPLRPLPGPTGLALLALSRSASRLKIIDQGIDYLKIALAETLAPVSIGWGLLGLKAWDAWPIEAEAWLASSFANLSRKEPGPMELAMLLLAWCGPGSLFGDPGSGKVIHHG